MNNTDSKKFSFNGKFQENQHINPLIIVEGLKKFYPVKGQVLGRNKPVIHAVDGVDLEIYEGETLGIVGESGCGKSTVGRQIVALERPTSGRILYRGEDISHMPVSKLRKIRTDLQMVFQDSTSSLNPRKQVYEILAAPMLYHKTVKKENIDNEIDRLLDLVGLPKAMKYRYPHEFSGGQRQRIGIAKALSLNPKVIVCDEPVSALDVSVQAQILNLLKELQEELKLTYVFIAHGLGAVRYISNRIAIMYLGRIVEIADTKELFENPVHPYTKALFDASPLPVPTLRDRKRIILKGEIPSAISPPQGCRFHTRCPYALESCTTNDPMLLPVKPGSSHKVACPVLLAKGENHD
ncbi:oligopeptide transport system ATP-binding protein [Herbinix hemicellulosilytica]|uniref:Oligopeptide transport ATP-binding protein AppF n=1 Tax=Herbinix hemicellulosilytica TaxID=1564487 RepID=A0A0H5SHS3_HERHM|nr:ABC transporter ATP-binding protein [Herbinix hemicellulosilytica]RBP58526.1 oligopeptide transport system ATP-binding protein [Herbinix hemicellulosilytica]CRZ35009.1 Oligopeptide transport ATP-binding protein AppF [Herbinix hemicellulosilytica]